jgi:ABC-type glycerol-3-phosphate transport system substrate-binding protein
MKKIALVLIGVLVAGIPLFAGGGRQTAPAAAGGLSTVKIFGANREYTVAGKSLKLSDWYSGSIPSRLWDAFVAEMTKRGVKLELDLVMYDQMKTVFQTTLASGRFNDYDMVSLGYDHSDETIAHNLYSQNRLYPWNKAIDQYSAGPARDYYFNSENGKFYAKLQTLEDGNFYWILGTQETYYNDPSYPAGSFISGMIRQDWLQTLGLGIPKTLDEFYNALAAFQQNDINKNGVKDEVAQISMEGFGTGVAEWFGLGRELVSAIDNKAVSPWYQPHVQDYIRYMNRLYKAGLLRVDTEGGAMQANRLAYISNWAGETWEEPSITVPAGAANAYFAPFVLQALPDTPARVWFQSGRQISWTPAFIPARAKNIEGVVKVMDYQVTKDFAILTESGIEGYTFRYDSTGNIIEGEPNPNNVGVDVELINAALPTMFTSGSIIPRHMMSDMVAEILAVAKQGYQLKADFLEACYNKTWPFIMDRDSSVAFPAAREMERMAAIRPDLETYSSELLASLIMGEKILDNWNTYMADLKRLGLDELVGIYQARLDRAR